MAARGAKVAAGIPGDREDDDGTEAVLVSEVVPATRERIFAAWMNSEQHSAFTGDEAVIEPVVGGAHSSLAGRARGTTLVLEPFRRIVQSWRAREFPADAGDSTVEITFEDTVGGTLVTLLHTEIPQGLSDRCRDAWLNSYLEPLKRYFTGRVTNGVHTADTQAFRGKRKGRLAVAAVAAASAPPGRKKRPRAKAKRAAKPLRRATAKKRAGAAASDKRRAKRAAAAKSRASATASKTSKRTRPASKKAVRKRAGSKAPPRKRR
jgi:uncharacterized protein YndB with AHSA1/START domain